MESNDPIENVCNGLGGLSINQAVPLVAAEPQKDSSLSSDSNVDVENGNDSVISVGTEDSTSDDHDENVNEDADNSSTEGEEGEVSGHDEDDNRSTESEGEVSGDDDEGDHSTPVGEPDSHYEVLAGEYRAAKLYRFDAGSKQWKERGTGELHILESVIQTHQYRVVMWVTGTGKVACNFRVFPEITVSIDQHNPKTVFWRCNDFSDVDLPGWESFACRFKMEQDCIDFKMKMDAAIKSLQPNAPEEEPKEQPSNCSGCVGCDPDAFEFPPAKEIKKLEPLIEDQLDSDSCRGPPNVVELAMFL